jgi:hypothetical protein
LKEVISELEDFKVRICGFIANDGSIGTHMKSLCPEWGQTLLGIDRISLDVEQDISEVLSDIGVKPRALARGYKPILVFNVLFDPFKRSSSATSSIIPTAPKMIHPTQS